MGPAIGRYATPDATTRGGGAVGAPRYWKMIGFDAPAWHDILLETTKPQGHEHFPLHVKAVDPINIAAVHALPCAHPATKIFFTTAVRWLTDASLYNAVGRPDIRKSLYSTAQIEEMTGIKIEPFEGEPLAGLFGFPRLELAKERYRPIFAPDTNDALDRSTLQRLQHRTRNDIRRDVHAGEYCVQLDMASYYDQFVLGDSIKPYFVFTHNKKNFSLRTLAMGQRQACEVAQATTWVLVDFPRPHTVKCTTCIDSVRFVGPRSDVIRAVRDFLLRCRMTGAQLNELPKSDTREITDELIDSLSETRGTFLGEMYDYVKKTIEVSPKTIKKIQTTRQRLADSNKPLTPRAYAAHIALLFYATSTLGTHLGRYFDALRHYRQFSAWVQEDQRRWSSGAIYPPMSRSCLEETLAWTDEVLLNTPRRVATLEEISQSPTLTIITDASLWGWAAVAVDARTGTAMTHSQQWDPSEAARMHESAVSEPEAVWRSICRFARPSEPCIRILTDHQPLVAPSKRGYGKGWNPNLLLLRAHCSFPRTRLEIVHIHGDTNPADQASRGEDVWDLERVRAMTDMARKTGDTEGAQDAEEREGEIFPAHKPSFMI